MTLQYIDILSVMSTCWWQNVIGIDRKDLRLKGVSSAEFCQSLTPVQITGNSERHDVTVSDDWPKLPVAICSEETYKRGLPVTKSIGMDKPVIRNYLWCLAFAIESSVFMAGNSTWIITSFYFLPAYQDHTCSWAVSSGTVYPFNAMNDFHGASNAQKFWPQSSRRVARRMIPVYALQSVLKNLKVMSWRGLLYWQPWEQDCCERHCLRKNKVQMSNCYSPVHQKSTFPYQTDISWTFLLQLESNHVDAVKTQLPCRPDREVS